MKTLLSWLPPIRLSFLLFIYMISQGTCQMKKEDVVHIYKQQVNASTVEGAEKKVFAHYMVCCPAAGGGSTLEDYKNEIIAAQQRGIDGFALNCGGWQESEPHYKKRTLEIYEAARQLETNFHLFVSVDGAAFQEVEDIILSFRDHPNQFRYHGKPVVSTFGGEGDDNTDGQSLVEQVHSLGAVLVPYFFPRPITELPTEQHASQLLRTFPDVDGYFYFGGAGTGEQIAASIGVLSQAFTGAGKIFMAGITPFYRGNGGNFRLFETRGFEAMAQEWESAISNGATWVELVTWNDWSESSYVAPFGGPADTLLWDGHFGPKMLSHVAYLDASRYYIDWFKAGSPPPIEQDKLFYFYRLHPKRKAIAAGIQKGKQRKRWPSGAYALNDEVFVTLFLTKPAQLTITSGDKQRQFEVAAGVNHVSMPFSTGKQHFALSRDGQLLISKEGEHQISAHDTQSRFNYFSGSAMAPAAHKLE